MSRTLQKEYFENRQQQNKIELALTEAIPPDVYYHNLILALTKLLNRVVLDAYSEEIYTKSVCNPTIAKVDV